MTDIATILVALLGPYAGDLTPGAPTPLAERVYQSLPPMYRAADTRGELRAFVTALGDVAGAAEILVDALNYVPADEGGPGVDVVPGGRSILTDPAVTVWPDWLAQAVGVNLRRAGIADSFSPDARAAIAGAVNGWRAGSRASLEEAARRALTGTRTVRVRPHLTADPWVVTVSTATDETPDADALEAAVRAVLPAGFDLELDHSVGNWLGVETPGSWAALTASAPTWADVEELFTSPA